MKDKRTRRSMRFPEGDSSAGLFGTAGRMEQLQALIADNLDLEQRLAVLVLRKDSLRESIQQNQKNIKTTRCEFNQGE